MAAIAAVPCFIFYSMRLFCIIVIFAGLPFCLSAQIGFNKTYTHSFGVNKFARLIVEDDTIFCIGTAYDTSIAPSFLKVWIVKLDTLGNVLQTRIYKDSLNGIQSMDFLRGDVVKTSREYFAFNLDGISRPSVQILQVDKMLETKAVFEYSIGNNYVEFYNQLLEMPDGGFMIVGTAQRPNLKTDGFIRRIDINGNVLWFKYYGDYNKDEYMSALAKASENYFVISGGGNAINNDPFNARASIWAIDSNGIVLDTWLGPNSPDLTNISKLMTAPDGGFIGTGSIYWGQGDWGGRVQVALIKLDSNFQLQWLKGIGPNTSVYNGMYDLVYTPDGNYLAAGERTAYGDLSQSSTDWGGWLYKFSPAGDSLWSRSDNSPPGMNASGEFVYGGVGVLSSGSIVAGGKGDIDGKFVGWVVKVTPDGCMDTLFCKTSAIIEIPKTKRCTLSPNPAQDMIQLRFGEAMGPGTLVQVWDLAGRLMRTQSIETGTLTQAISVAGFAEGCYLVVFIENGKVVAREKLV